MVSFTNFLFFFTGAIKTYFKTLKARQKRITTRVRAQGSGQMTNKQAESVVIARRNQRGHNVSYYYHI